VRCSSVHRPTSQLTSSPRRSHLHLLTCRWCQA